MTSHTLFERALRRIPGGVNSPVRAFRSVGGTPVYIASASGARMTTVEGRELVDFCGSWGPLILGHARVEVIEAIREAAGRGTSYGTNTAAEVEFAETLHAMVPSLEMMRLVNSGTEAVMTAIRLARGVTGRERILKFDGCYHGHSDGLLVSAGSGLLTGGIATSEGVTRTAVQDVFVAPYNDLNALRALSEAHGSTLAAIIVEPVAGNMGLVLPAPGFLAGLRDIADRCGALLIFDEVITGFRFGPTTYGHLCGVEPDLTTLGKIIGGGLPIGAVGGRAAVMEALAPLGKVYQAGTLSGNPVAVAAGAATLRILARENPYPGLEKLGRRTAAGLAAAAAGTGVALQCAQLGSLFTPFFTASAVRNLTDAKGCDTQAYARFFHGMLQRGFYLPPAQFEASFISAAHTEQDINEFTEAARRVWQEIAPSGGTPGGTT